jgi:hypothetical protein
VIKLSTYQLSTYLRHFAAVTAFQLIVRSDNSKSNDLEDMSKLSLAVWHIASYGRSHAFLNGPREKTILAVINAAPLTLNSERCSVCMTLRRRKARAHFVRSRWEILRLSLRLSRFTLSLHGDHPVTWEHMFSPLHPQGVVDGMRGGPETERGLRWRCQISSGRQGYNTTCQ